MAKLPKMPNAQDEIWNRECEVARLRNERFKFVADQDFDNAMSCRIKEDELNLEIFNLIMENCL